MRFQFSVFQSSAAWTPFARAGVDLGTVFSCGRLVNPEPAAEGKVPFANWPDQGLTPGPPHRSPKVAATCLSLALHPLAKLAPSAEETLIVALIHGVRYSPTI